MKKVLVIFGLILLAVIVIIAFFLIWASNRKFVPGNYTKRVETGGEIEAAYLEAGPYGVSMYEEAVMQGFKKYIIYYPSELESEKKQHPAVVFANGSGCRVSKYPALLEHLASWGFIAIGTEEEYDWSGFSSEMCVRHLIRLNGNERINGAKNIFYGKVNLDSVGITGHSQGGVGVFNAITVQEHSEIFRAAVSLSPTNKELADALEWNYDAAKINTPILLISGAGGGDDWVVTGEQLESIYNDIPGSKVMLRRVNTDHGAVLYSADGYVTAWFMWQLQGDEKAAKAFSGQDAEILKNSLYQDQQVSIANYRIIL